MWGWIALLVVIIIVYVVVFSKPGFDTYDGTSYIGASAKGLGGNFKVIASATDAQACQAACGDAAWCKGYTFINDNGDQKCVAIRNMNKSQKLTGGSYTSGVKQQGYAPKLMHLFGSESAGKSSESYMSAPKQGLEFMDGMAAPKVNEFLTMNAPAQRLEFLTVNAPAQRLEFMDGMAAPKVNEFLTMNAPAQRLEFITGSDPYAYTNAADYSS